MKLKDLIGKSKNNKNKQSNWNPKKRVLKKSGITEEQLLDMEIDNYLKRFVK